VDVLTPSARIVVGDAVIVEVVVDIGPGANLTAALFDKGTPFKVALTVAVPTTTDEVRVTVYVPFKLSVIAPRVPIEEVNTTVAPPAVRLLPYTSLACSVIVDVVAPLPTIEAGDAKIAEVTGDAVPGTVVIVGDVPV